MLFSVRFPKEIRYVWSHCLAVWAHSFCPVPFHPSEDPQYFLYQISLKLSKDKYAKSFIKNRQCLGKTPTVSPLLRKRLQQEHSNCLHSWATSTCWGAKQTDLAVVPSHGGTEEWCQHRRGRKGSVQQKAESCMAGRAGGCSTDPVKERDASSTGSQALPKFCWLQAKGDTLWVLQFILCWALNFGYVLPPIFITYMHNTSLTVCLSLNDLILHHSSTPIRQRKWCKTLVIITMTQDPLA